MTRETRIAARRLRVTIEEPVLAPDGLGGFVRSYQTRATQWAKLTPASAKERAEAQRPEAAVIHRLTLRFRDDLTAAMRITSGPALFNILARYDPDGRRRDLVCVVEETTP